MSHRSKIACAWPSVDLAVEQHGRDSLLVLYPDYFDSLFLDPYNAKAYGTAGNGPAAQQGAVAEFGKQRILEPRDGIPFQTIFGQNALIAGK